MLDSIAFTSLGARSKSLVWGISIVLVVESVALHALLLKRWPWFSAVLVAFNAYTIWWLARGYRAVAELPTLVKESGVVLRVGHRALAEVPYGVIARLSRPSWQEIPGVQTPGYLKLSGSDDPNVLIHFTEPVWFRMMFGIRKSAQIVGLRLDAADGFVQVVSGRLNRIVT